MPTSAVCYCQPFTHGAALCSFPAIPTLSVCVLRTQGIARCARSQLLYVIFGSPTQEIRHRVVLIPCNLIGWKINLFIWSTGVDTQPLFRHRNLHARCLLKINKTKHFEHALRPAGNILQKSKPWSQTNCHNFDVWNKFSNMKQKGKFSYINKEYFVCILHRRMW